MGEILCEIDVSLNAPLKFYYSKVPTFFSIFIHFRRLQIVVSSTRYLKPIFEAVRTTERNSAPRIKIWFVRILQYCTLQKRHLFWVSLYFVENIWDQIEADRQLDLLYTSIAAICSGQLFVTFELRNNYIKDHHSFINILKFILPILTKMHAIKNCKISVKTLIFFVSI